MLDLAEHDSYSESKVFSKANQPNTHPIVSGVAGV